MYKPVLKLLVRETYLPTYTLTLSPHGDGKFALERLDVDPFLFPLFGAADGGAVMVRIKFIADGKWIAHCGRGQKLPLLSLLLLLKRGNRRGR